MRRSKKMTSKARSNAARLAWQERNRLKYEAEKAAEDISIKYNAATNHTTAPPREVQPIYIIGTINFAEMQSNIELLRRRKAEQLATVEHNRSILYLSNNKYDDLCNELDKAIREMAEAAKAVARSV